MTQLASWTPVTATLQIRLNTAKRCLSITMLMLSVRSFAVRMLQTYGTVGREPTCAEHEQHCSKQLGPVHRHTEGTEGKTAIISSPIGDTVGYVSSREDVFVV